LRLNFPLQKDGSSSPVLVFGLEALVIHTSLSGVPEIQGKTYVFGPFQGE
jgi:hypothetical protein